MIDDRAMRSLLSRLRDSAGDWSSAVVDLRLLVALRLSTCGWSYWACHLIEPRRYTLRSRFAAVVTWLTNPDLPLV